MSVRASLYVNYQTSPETFFYAMSLIQQALAQGLIHFRDCSFMDAARILLNSGHAPSNQMIDGINKALSIIKAPYPLLIPSEEQSLLSPLGKTSS